MKNNHHHQCNRTDYEVGAAVSISLQMVIGARSRMKNHVNMDLSSLNVVMFYLASITDLMAETTRYYHQTPNSLPVVTNSEMFSFLAIVQMSDDICDRLGDLRDKNNSSHLYTLIT